MTVERQQLDNSVFQSLLKASFIKINRSYIVELIAIVKEK